MRDDYLRVGTIVKQIGRSCWNDPNKLLRIAKRKRADYWGVTYTYFVVGIDDAPGHGIWASKDKLRPLTALEQLAMVAE